MNNKQNNENIADSCALQKDKITVRLVTENYYKTAGRTRMSSVQGFVNCSLGLT